MRLGPGLLLVAFLLLISPLSAQQGFPVIPRPGSPTPFVWQPPSRDTQAVALIQTALQALGNVPGDSTATGSVTIISGTKTANGAVAILTRGTDQSSEQIQMSDGTSTSVIFSKGQANEVQNGTVKPSPMELVASSQNLDNPLPFLAGAFNNPDVSFQYIGQETLADGSSVQHIRFWDTYASKPLPRIASEVTQKMPPAALDMISQGPRIISEFTVKDIWLDGRTNLPRQLAYQRRAGRGAVPHINIEIFYSNWQSSGGTLYPQQIQKSWNGTRWMTITVQNVAVQTGLTDTSFPIQMAAKLGVQQ